MKDREFLMWVHERLELVYGDNPLMDYMYKLRSIINATPAEQETPNTVTCTSLEGLRERLERES